MGLTRTATPHLFSGVIAVGRAAAILFACRMIAIHLEHKTIHALAPWSFLLKNQDPAFQRSAARTQGVLPLYRRSDLLSPIRGRAGVFFRICANRFTSLTRGTSG